MRNNKRICLPISHWPESDRCGWLIALVDEDPLSPGNVASAWSSATIRKVATGYGRYLAWLDGRGALATQESIADRVSHERLVAYLDNLAAKNRGHTLHNRIQELEHFQNEPPYPAARR
jgi:hypothetical protein